MSTLLRVFPETQSLPSISNCFQDQVGEKSCFSLKIRVASRGEGCQMVQPVHWGVSIAGIKRDHFSPKTAMPPTDTMSYLSFLLTRCYNMLITFDFQKTLSWDIPNMSKNQSVASKLFSCPTLPLSLQGRMTPLITSLHQQVLREQKHSLIRCTASHFQRQSFPACRSLLILSKRSRKGENAVGETERPC